MQRSVGTKNISLYDECDTNQQLINLKLLDETTNIEYVVKVGREVYNRAHNDMIFATTLLQKAKTLLNSKENRHSSFTSFLNMMHANDNNKPSCSNINTVLNNITENNTSDTENISDTSDTEVITEKWGHKAILLLTSLYKEKSCIIEKGSHKKMWIEISRMKQKKHNFTGSQCNNKMDVLKRRYRLIVDHNAQSGNDKREWIYFDVLDDIFRNKHWITPVSIAGSNIKESEHSPLTDSNDENKPAIKQRKISLTDARTNYLKVSLEEKRLKREETANYRATKLQILEEIKEAFKNHKQ